MIKINYINFAITKAIVNVENFNTHSFPKYIEDLSSLYIVDCQYPGFYGFLCKNGCGVIADEHINKMKNSDENIYLYINYHIKGSTKGAWDRSINKYYTCDELLIYSVL